MMEQPNLQHPHHAQHHRSPEDMYFRIDHQEALELDSENRVASYCSFECFDADAWDAEQRQKQADQSNNTNGAAAAASVAS